MPTATNASGMPTRRFSAAILSGLWPQTDPVSCHDLATRQQQKGADLLADAGQIRATTSRLTAEQSGATVNAFDASGHRLVSTATDHADRYFAMARASREVGHILHGLRADLDSIDSTAHTRIDRIARSATPLTAQAAEANIIRTIARARADATSTSTAAATAIADQGIGLGFSPSPTKRGAPGDGPAAGPDDRIVDPGKGGPAAQAVDFRGVPLPEDRGNDRPWEYNLDLTSGNVLDTPGYPNAGTAASIDDVWNELHRCFNCNFPIGGAPKEFPKVGDKLPLSVGMGSAGPNLPFPVQVTQVTKTADAIDIEFVTLPGHTDGPDATIHFRFFENGGQLHLGVRGYIPHGPGAIEDFPRNLTAPAERVGYTAVAHVVWQPYLDRLTANIAAAKGLPIYQPPLVARPGLPVGVPGK